MSEAERTSLFRRNRNAFRRHHPKIWAELERIEKPVSQAIIENDLVVNIDLGDIRLYPDPAPAWTARQLDDYFTNPDRLGFENPFHCNLSPVSVEVLRHIGEYLAEHKRAKLASYPVVDVGYAFIFGVGLGLHVADLVRRKVARNLILIEPIPEFLLHSMQAVDWNRIFAAARKQGMAIEFLLGKDPGATIDGIEVLFSRRGTTFLDGSYAYRHYHSWVLQEARAQLNEKIKVFYFSSGFFEDEILMMQNTYGNLRERAFHVVDRRPRIARRMPAFVIGSGSSLDRDLPYIKKWRDRAIVCSCGTSLGILLKNGIRPDLHVENENTLPLVKNLQNFRDTYGLDGIRLVCTTTLRPEASGLFDQRWFITARRSVRARCFPAASSRCPTPIHWFPTPAAPPWLTWGSRTSTCLGLIAAATSRANIIPATPFIIRTATTSIRITDRMPASSGWCPAILAARW